MEEKLSEPLEESLRGRSVRVSSVQQLVAFPSVPTTVPWGDCLDTACDTRTHRLTVVAEMPARGELPLPVTLQLERAAFDQAQASRGPSPTHGWQTTFEQPLSLKHQEPLLLPDASAFGGGSVVVTAYLLTRHDDLFPLMACKSKQIGILEVRPQAAR